MPTRPASIRNVSWAVVRDGSERRHVYRRDVDLFLKDGKVTEITPAGARPQQADEPTLNASGLLALPGLVNIHSHPTTEAGQRGVREDHGVPEQQMSGLIERMQAFRLGEDGRRPAATLAYAEMLRAGTTTVCDITSPFDGWLELMSASGMRFYAAPIFASARWGMSSPQTVTWTWDEKSGLAQFEKAKRVMADAEADNSRRHDAIVFPTAIDTVSPELFAEARKYADQSGRRLSTHIAQCAPEVFEMIRRHNMTPVQWAAEQGLLSAGTILAHCILIDEHPQIRWHTQKDLDLIAESGASVAHCPQPFARYGIGLDHIGRYRSRGVTVGLGTDCAPHNLIEEMRLAIVTGRLMSGHINSLDTGGAFEAATLGGAAALGRDDLGALGHGMAADIVLVDLAHPLMQPARDPLRSFVFHAADRAVKTVLIGGEVVLANGEPLHLDPKAAMEKLAEAQARMIQNTPKIDYAQRPGDQISPLSLPMQ
jgi:5-methylthioadenosine/S-adenosylhomocysteine deaminase